MRSFPICAPRDADYTGPTRGSVPMGGGGPAWPGEGEAPSCVGGAGQTVIRGLGGWRGGGERCPGGPRRTVVDVDLDRSRQERMRTGAFDDNALTDAPLTVTRVRTFQQPGAVPLTVPVDNSRSSDPGMGPTANDADSE